MAMGEPAIKILVGNLGGAAPSGHSAVLIRKNLQAALSGQNGIKINVVPKFDVTAFVKTINTQLAAHAVKVNVTPVVSGTTGTKASTITSSVGGMSKTDLTFLEKQLATIETKAASLTQRLKNITNMPLQSKGMQQYQAQYDKIEQEIYELTAANRTLTETEKTGIRARVAELEKLVVHYEKLAAAQLKSADTISAYQQKAITAMGGASNLYGPQTPAGQQMIAVYTELEQALNRYAARGGELSKTERAQIDAQIAKLRELASESSRYYSNLEANRKRSAAEADKERAALASMKMELAKFNQYLLTLNPKALTQYSGQINNIKTLLGSGIAANGQKAAVAMKSFKAEMVAAGYEGGNAFAMLATKMKTYFSYFVSSSVIMALYSGVSNLISNVKTLDEAMTDLRIVTGGTREETEKLLDTYNALAQKIGTTTAETASAAVEWQRQGYNEADTNTLVEDSMILSVVGMVESADAAQYLTSAIKGYSVAASDAIGIVDKLTAVDLEAAVSAGGLAEAMARTANSARLAGVDMNSLIGYMATVGEVTQRDMSTVGEAFKTLFARYSNVKIGKLEDEETGESLNDFETVLNSVGIALRDAEGEFRNFDDVIQEVGQSWDSYSSVQKSAISTVLGGVRQRENVLVLFENLDNALKYAEIAANSAGTAMQKFGVYQESVEAKTARATAAFEKFSTSLLDSRLVGGIMDLGTGIFNFLSGLNGVPARIALVTAAVAALYSAVKSLGAMNIGKNFIGFFTGLG